ncbi:MAG: c-type cytochrome [Woeseiaceae bacterium]
MRQQILGILVGLVCVCLNAFAEDMPVAAEEYVYCTVCHGVQLMGNPIIKAPRLSGMEPWYVEKQLHNFKKEIRGLHEADPFGYEMQPMAAALSGEQIGEVAKFVNATRSPAAAPTISGDVETGRRLYATCAACHGADGKGNEALGSPDLRIANDWYLVTQLMNFKSGSRGSNPADINGMQMRASVQFLADEEAIVDVVSYITTLRDN